MKNYNLSGNLHKAIERAINVAGDFSSEELCTFHLGLAILMNDECCIQKEYLESGWHIDYKGMLYETLNQEEQYKLITGNEFPIRNDLEENSQEESQTDQKVDDDGADNTIVTETVYLVNESDYIDSIINYNNIEYSENLQLAFEEAYERCNSNGQPYIDEENMLFVLLSMENTSFYKLIQRYEFDISELKNILLMNANIYETSESKRLKIPAMLENCCEIMNDNYTKGDKCTILGRDKEIQSVWNIFSKKTKRNAILIGNAGVGKTAIVEAITMQIVNDECPEEFRGYNVISLNLTTMVAGTKYRGEFELKVQQLIKFLKATSNVIVFIDEIHQILGVGSAENSGPDLSGSLKPILARDDVVFIGSTTTLEYGRYFAVDPAFKRRFEKIEIKEPKLKDVKEMIKLKVDSLSKYHKVSITEDVLDYIIITAKAMNFSGNNPDITLDLVDRSFAIAKINKRKSLKRSDVVQVFKSNYETFKNMRKKDKLSTAYHEAGHALVRLLSKHDTREDLKIVSIIPTADYLGATISEPNGKFSPITKKAVLENASMALAGRVAQEFVNKNWDFGANADLSDATSIIRKMIIEMGMDENIYTNISLYDYNSSGHNMSPAAVDRVNDRIKEVMQIVYNTTKELLTKNKDKLDIIANLLMERGIISVQEIEEAFKKIK